MMKINMTFIICIFLMLIMLLLNACGGAPPTEQTSQEAPICTTGDESKSEEISEQSDGGSSQAQDDAIIAKYSSQTPRQWGETTDGVKTSLDTKEKVIALTFDACGGKNGNGYDKALIDYLVKEKIPATLFVNSRWIDANNSIFMTLADNSLFEIENHGAKHQPLSVNGKTAYHMSGTTSVTEVMSEVQDNADKIYQLTGRKPKFFRSGTNYYDELATLIVEELGEQAVGYSVLGDAGATYTAAQIKKACSSAKSGSIIICHMNHPEKDTAAGIKAAIPILLKEGYQFVKLEDYPLK